MKVFIFNEVKGIDTYVGRAKHVSTYKRVRSQHHNCMSS